MKLTNEQIAFLQDQAKTTVKETENVEDALQYVDDIVFEFEGKFGSCASDEAEKLLCEKIVELIKNVQK